MKSKYVGKQFGTALKDFGNDINSSIPKARTELTNEYVRRTVTTKGIVPEDTHTLIKSIVSTTEYQKGSVNATTPYAKFVSEGTKYMPAGGKTGKPYYLEVEMNENENYYKEFLINYFDKVIK